MYTIISLKHRLVHKVYFNGYIFGHYTIFGFASVVELTTAVYIIARVMLFIIFFMIYNTIDSGTCITEREVLLFSNLPRGARFST